jgi:hypothetical protein
MTLDLRNIWTSANKVLTTINLFLLALIQSGLSGPVKVKDSSDTKIPLVYNILLLIVLATLSSLLIYVFIGVRITVS